MEITWPVALAFIGTLVALLTFVNSLIKDKKDKSPWNVQVDKDRRQSDDRAQVLENRIFITESGLAEIKRRIQEIKHELASATAKNESDLNKIEEKIERISEIVIKCYSSHSK